MFEAINSVLDAIVHASWPRSVKAWLMLLFALGVIWYVAAGVMNGPTSRVAMAGALVSIAALVALVVYSIIAAARTRAGR